MWGSCGVGELRCRRVAVLGSRSVGELRCGGDKVWSCGVGLLQCGGVLVWGSFDVGELRCEGVMVPNSGQLSHSAQHRAQSTHSYFTLLKKSKKLSLLIFF